VKTTKSPWLSLMCILLILFALPAVTAQTAFSSKNSDILKMKVDLPAEKLTFTQSLERLHTQYKVNIIAAGSPLITEALIAESHTVAEALETVAAAFDYHWSIDKRGIVLLTKAFRYNGDYPQLDEKWIRHFAQENVTTLQMASSGNGWWLDEVVTLAKMLQPEQWLLLQSGQNLEGSSLSPNQLQQIQRAGVANRTDGAKGKWLQLSRVLSQWETVKIQLVPIVLDETPSDGLLYELRVFDVRSQSSPTYVLRALSTTLPKENKFFSMPSTTRCWNESGYFEEERGREYPKGATGRWSKPVSLHQADITLAQILSLLTAPMQLNYSAEDILLARRYFISCQNVTQRALTDAIAEIEDWHWNESPLGNVRFQPRSLKDTAGILAIPRRLQSALLRDLRDYLGARRPSLTAQEMIPTLVSDPRMLKMRWFDLRKSRLGYPELKKLIQRLETTKIAEAPVSIAKLKEDERRMLLSALLREAVGAMDYSLYGGDFPPYILAPHTAHLELSGSLLQIVSTRNADGVISTESFGAPVGKVMPMQSSPPSAPDNPQE